MNSDFEPPPKKLSILACVGGVVTAVVAIAALEVLSDRLHKTASVPQPKVSTAQAATSKLDAEAMTVAKLDAQSVELPGKAVTSAEISATKTPYVASGL